MAPTKKDGRAAKSHNISPAVNPTTRAARTTRRSTSGWGNRSVPDSDASSVHTPNASGNSTPATSTVPTPAPSISADGSFSMTLPKLGSRVEVLLPQRPAAPDISARSLRNSKYALSSGPSKRKYAEVNDTEDDEDFEEDAIESDAVLARRLQAEEYGEDTSALPSSIPASKGRPRATRGGSLLAAPPINGSEDDEAENSFIPRRSARVLQTGPKKGGNTKPVPRDRLASMTSKTPLSRSKPPRAAAASSTKRAKIDLISSYDSNADSLDDDSEESAYSDLETDIEEPTKPAPKRVARPPPRTKRIPQLDENDSELSEPANLPTDDDSDVAIDSEASEGSDTDMEGSDGATNAVHAISNQRRAFRRPQRKRAAAEQKNIAKYHPGMKSIWEDLESLPVVKSGKAPQPKSITRLLKPFQLEGLAWMQQMELGQWKGGILGDEMGLGKTIQAVSLIMSDFPAKKPSLVLVPPVALMQWVSEIDSYTDSALKTFVWHGTNAKTKHTTTKSLKEYNVILMSYNTLESMYRKQEKGLRKGDVMVKAKSIIHAIQFHRVILDEAHCIKTRSTMTAKACFALNTEYRWCLTGTPLQNRIGEFYSLIRYLNVKPFASYLCKRCPCDRMEWDMDEHNRCKHCEHAGLHHFSIFNNELLNPIQKFGNTGPGATALKRLRTLTDRLMLRRLKKDHTNSMELPVKEIYVNRQFFGEEENDLANSIMTNGQRKFDTYVAQGVLLNNYANIFGLIMQMRQVADHPDLILKKNAEGGQNVLVCCICDEPAEDAIRSRCRHDFCRACAKHYLQSSDEPDCPQCHIPLSIDLEQPEMEQDQSLMKKTSIINRIKMENWTSSSKIELLVHELHKLRSDNASHKSIIFSQFTTMLQLIEWRLRRAGITTVMLDGTMTPAQRQASIDYFMKNVNVECFLVSLKAGGVALNLTEASRVFIVDPWWNPAAEWQSADRCHRIGQTRPCIITRLCIEDSVESRMVLIQEKKTNMINSTVNADDKAMESLSPEDMQFLFRGN